MRSSWVSSTQSEISTESVSVFSPPVKLANKATDFEILANNYNHNYDSSWIKMGMAGARPYVELDPFAFNRPLQAFSLLFAAVLCISSLKLQLVADDKTL